MKDRPTTSSTSSSPPLLVMDIISMGHKQTEKGKLMLQSQRDTWVQEIPGSRFFYPATEDVCFPECLSQHVSREERYQRCNTDSNNDDDNNDDGNSMMKSNHNNNNNNNHSTTSAITTDRPKFWPYKILRSHDEETLGWWCAQKRVAWALRDLMDLYTTTATANTTEDESLSSNYYYPDWLLIVDDDTWFNPYFMPDTLLKLMNRHHQQQQQHRKNTNGPTIATAPSLLVVADDVLLGKPSLHYGGVGLAINRRLLQAMNRPVYCRNGTTTATSSSSVDNSIHCLRLQESGLFDQFQDGMAMIDFIMELLNRRVSCLHSDWWQGLLIWLSGSRIEQSVCPNCVNLEQGGGGIRRQGSSFGSHMAGACGPKMLSCHRMTHLRMPEMTEMAMNCSRSNFQPFVPCQQIISFGEKKN